MTEDWFKARRHRRSARCGLFLHHWLLYSSFAASATKWFHTAVFPPTSVMSEEPLKLQEWVSCSCISWGCPMGGGGGTTLCKLHSDFYELHPRSTQMLLARWEIKTPWALMISTTTSLHPRACSLTVSSPLLHPACNHKICHLPAHLIAKHVNKLAP